MNNLWEKFWEKSILPAWSLLYFNSLPKGLEDVSTYPQLLAKLLEDPTWTEDDIKKLAGLNLLRVFGKVEQVMIMTHFLLLPSDSYYKCYIVIIS